MKLNSANICSTPEFIDNISMTENDFIRLSNLSKSYQEGDRTRLVLHNANAACSKGMGQAKSKAKLELE